MLDCVIKCVRGWFFNFDNILYMGYLWEQYDEVYCDNLWMFFLYFFINVLCYWGIERVFKLF